MAKMNAPEIEIIDAPEAKTLSRRLADGSITAFMWALWLYLLLPILNVVVWVAGIHFFYSAVIAPADARNILGLMSTVGWAILAVFVILRIWGLYNYWAFGRHDRRRAKDMSTIYGLARFHRIPPSRILALQDSREIVWPAYRTPDRAREVEDWLAAKRQAGVTPIRQETQSDHGTRHSVMETAQQKSEGNARARTSRFGT